MINNIFNRLKNHSIKKLCEYLDVHENTFYLRQRKGEIPRKYHRRIVEYIEMLNDDGVDICQKIMKK